MNEVKAGEPAATYVKGGVKWSIRRSVENRQ